MNKKLLTLAVAGAIVGGMGVAQADVTAYGKAHFSIDRENTPGEFDNTSVSNNSSRLGFKFTEDLGNGWKASGQYETAVGLDGEQNTFFSARNSYLGLGSDALGTVMVGKLDTPMKNIGRAVELFPEYVGDARNITAPEDADERWNNVIAYSSPNWGGVGFMLSSNQDNVNTGTAANDTDVNSDGGFSANVTYKGGPVFVGGAYEKHKNAGEDWKAYRLAASGTFGMFKVVALYQNVDQGATDRSSYGLGGSVTLAEKHVLKTQVYVADATSNTTPDDGATMVALGYDYKFSKKVTGYVAYAKTSNDAGGAFLVSNPATNQSGHGEGLVPTTGQDVQAASIGMIMDF